MSETQTPEAQATKPQQTETQQGDPAALGDAGKKALDAEREARKTAEKLAADLKAKLDKIEAANMSDLERAQKERDEARAEVEKVPAMVADHLRSHLSEIHKISDEQRDLYLTSNDPATLLRQAAGIASQATTIPKPDPTQGAQHALALNGDGLTEALARAVGART